MDTPSSICTLVNEQFKRYLGFVLEDQDMILLDQLSLTSKVIPKKNSTNLETNLITTNFKFHLADNQKYDVEILADEMTFQMLIIFPFYLKAEEIEILKIVNRMNDRYSQGSFSFNFETSRIEFKIHILLFGLDFVAIDELLKGFFPFMFSEIYAWNNEINKGLNNIKLLMN